jgi:lipid II:glycine glycyltransferase (peptidoglycan interpeptide bridge formation enzyme)
MRKDCFVVELLAMTVDVMQIAHNKLDQQTWDTFVLKHGPRSGRFLQSFAWGEFLGKGGEGGRGGKERNVIDRVAWVSDANEVVAVAQVIQKTIPFFGTYAYVPRGPIGVISRTDVTDLAAQNLFIRIEFGTESNQKIPVLNGKKIHPIQPVHTLITDLAISTDERLARMHEKTRYNIRLAEKKGVKIEMQSATMDEVWSVFEATASRDAFRLHGKEYYRKMIESGVAFLAVAKHEDDILAANIMIDFGDTRTYLHGASSNVKRNLMAPYLLHWELMKDAQSKGITFYDWWGVAPIDAPANHPWAGISRFKRGFGGEDVSYSDAVDVVLKRGRYTLYQVLRKLRRGFR